MLNYFVIMLSWICLLYSLFLFITNKHYTLYTIEWRRGRAFLSLLYVGVPRHQVLPVVFSGRRKSGENNRARKAQKKKERALLRPPQRAAENGSLPRPGQEQISRQRGSRQRGSIESRRRTPEGPGARSIPRRRVESGETALTADSYSDLIFEPTRYTTFHFYILNYNTSYKYEVYIFCILHF